MEMVMGMEMEFVDMSFSNRLDKVSYRTLANEQNEIVYFCLRLPLRPV